jgi:two-component system, OmpR family, copper resistance phosphate regulon response regulator CusR
MNILVVEDEPKVADFIKRGLEENGNQAVVAFDGRIGKSMFLNESFDFVILDVNIPGINGFDLCREIRSINGKIPILMLTALGATDDKLAGFESGADDYLVKPFEFRELIARMRALRKRAGSSPDEGTVLRIADLELNQDTRKVIRAGKIIELTPKEFALLEMLLRNKGRVISRLDIAEKIWDITFDTGTNVIDVYVNFLRKKIDRDHQVKLIHTQIGMGYVLKTLE